jgi:uncharacterized protein YbjQ (UPF0145 family)
MVEEDPILQTQDSEQQASLARIEAGGIPLSAQRRLRELAEREGAFTSDLSVADFALCDRLGLKPLSQVMGTSVYQIGYQGTLWGFGAEMTELTTVSEAWNEARDLALGRLAEEASCVGASAVVGVNVSSSTANWAEVSGYGAIEYLITGTAVRRQGHDADRAPVLTELSVADYAKLLAAGVEPAGIVAWTSVFFVSSVYMSAERPLLGGAYYQSFEYREVTECFYGARERVTSEIGRQAQALGAAGIVGVRIGHTVHSGSLRMGGPGLTQSGSERPGMIASFSAIGTAVRMSSEHSVQAPMTIVAMT